MEPWTAGAAARRWWAIAIAAGLAAGCSGPGGDGGPAAPTAAPTVAAPAVAAAGAPNGLVDVVARAEPSVATIITGDGLGSGVVYRSGGVLVTNAHVVGAA